MKLSGAWKSWHWGVKVQYKEVKDNLQAAS